MDLSTPDCFSPFKGSKNTGTYPPITQTPIKNTLSTQIASDNACRAQLSQEHNGAEFLIVFLSHRFTETQRKWSTTEQEAYGVHYTITKWNYYLQGTDTTVKNYHKPLAQFLNGKNANKVNRWSLEIATYSITIEWILGAKNKAADCLSWLVKPTSTSTSLNMLTASPADGPTFNTRGIHNTPLLVPPQLHTPISHPEFSRSQLQPKTTHS